MSKSSSKLELGTFLVSIFALTWLSAQHHNGLLGLLDTPMESPLFATPCLVFGLTISAYYRFVTDYRGHVAGLSLLNSVVALALCLMLVESRDWWDHLRLIYALFFSYVVWDILMGYYLGRVDKDDPGCVPTDVLSDIEETRIISILINQPTLVTVFLVWLYTTFMQARGEPSAKLTSYISGVVSFHLAFSSVAYLFIRFYLKHHTVTSTPLSSAADGKTPNGGPSGADPGPPAAV